MNSSNLLADRQAIVDAEHLRLLSIFHYVVGGISALFSSMFLFHVFFGLALASHPEQFGRLVEEQVSIVQASPAPKAAGTPHPFNPYDPAPERETSGSPRNFRHLFPPGRNQPPAFIGYLFAGMGAIGVLIGWTAGGLTILSGRNIRRRRHRTFSLVVAGLNCMFFPFGTVLGVFTFIVLLRPTVAWLYHLPRMADSVPPPIPPF